MVIAVVLMLIPKSTYEKIFGVNEPTNKPTVYDYYQVVYVIDTNERLVGLKVGVEAILEDQIRQKWDLLTENNKTLPVGYTSPISKASLNSYQIIDEVLNLDVSEEFLTSNGKLAISSLAWTFCNEDDNIKEVIVNINGEKLTELKDYHFNKINKKIVANTEYETNFLYEAKYTTVIHYENDTIIPVTYFYLNTDECDYIVSKLFDEELCNSEEYDYLLSAEQIVINLGISGTINNNTLKALVDTLAYNYEAVQITINGLDNIIYKTVTNEIDPTTPLV